MSANHELPPGWPDPYALLRDPKWEENYPKLLLRGIYDVMQRVPGGIEERYLAGFNIVVYRLTKATPPRLNPDDITHGILTVKSLTAHTGGGKEREKEVLGRTKLSPKSKRRYGDKSPSEMRTDTDEKMKLLRIEIEKVRAANSKKGMPAGGNA